MSDLSAILAFLKSHQQCVLATVGQDGRPQAAVVNYTVNDVAEIMFGTEEFTRKYKNLLRDSRVAIVVGFDTVSVQIEGASKLLAGEELAIRKNEHFAMLSVREKNKDTPGFAYFSVAPTWLRLTDTATEPWSINEVSFDDKRV